MVLSVAVIIGGCLYILILVTSDHLEFRENDLAYLAVVTSQTVSGLPRFKAGGDPADFVYSAREGTAPGQIIMTYLSEDTAEGLAQKHRDHCLDRGYAQVPEDQFLLPAQVACDAEDYRIEIALQERGDQTLVTVNFLERYR